jgi:hypothetical protein
LLIIPGLFSSKVIFLVLPLKSCIIGLLPLLSNKVVLPF